MPDLPTLGHIDDISKLEVRVRFPNEANSGHYEVWISMRDLIALVTLVQQSENPPTLPAEPKTP